MTEAGRYDIIIHVAEVSRSPNRLEPRNAGIAQLVEQLICNQQVGGSSPSTSSNLELQRKVNMGGFPSGQREQTVNLSSMTSVVRIHHLPPKQKRHLLVSFLFLQKMQMDSNGRVARIQPGESAASHQMKDAALFQSLCCCPAARNLV